MTGAAIKRMKSVDNPATAGQPIRFVLSPRDDPRTEQYRRVALLKKGLPFLEGLPPADLKALAEAGLPYRFEPGQKVCNQGDTLATEPRGAFAIYVVEKGNPQAFIEGVGRVHEYAVGEAFGELAPLTNQPRATSVQINATAKQPAELMVFPGEAVQAALSKWTDDERQEHYDALTKEYADARAVRDDPRLIAEINELWNIMVEESKRLTGRDLNGMVTREAYIALHLRVGRALQSDFDVQASENNANMDWAEDITAFSGEDAASIWLEEVKKKFHDVASKVVLELGMKDLFAKYDDDGSGDLDYAEFASAIRDDLKVEETVLSNGDLKQMFRSIDVDGSGEVDATEFAEWLLHDTPDDIRWRPMKRKFEDSAGATVQKVGWGKLFARYDTDGSGELDFSEFASAVRKDCDINEDVVSDEDLKSMFDAVDADGSGEMDADEFREFIESNALAQDMAFEIFYEAMFQLAELWVAKEDAAQYTLFFAQLRGRIADWVVDTDGVKKQLLRGIRTEVDANGHQVYILTDVQLIESFVNDEGETKMDGLDLKDPMATSSEEDDEEEPEPEPEPEPESPPRRGKPFVMPELELPRAKTPPPEGPSEKDLRLQAMREHEAKGDAEEKPWSVLKRTEYERALEHADGNLDKKRIQAKLKEVVEQIAAEKERKRLARQALADEAEAARKAAEARRKAEEEAARLAAMQEELARRRAAANAAHGQEDEQPYEGRKRRPPSPNPRGIFLWAYLYSEVCQKVPLPKVEATFLEVDEQHGGTGSLEREQLLTVCELLGLVHKDPAAEVKMMDDMFRHARNSYIRGVKTESNGQNYGVRVNLVSFVEWWKSNRRKPRKEIKPTIMESWIKQNPHTQPGTKRRLRSTIQQERFPSHRGHTEPSPVWSEDAFGDPTAASVPPDTWGRPVEAVMAPQPKPLPCPPQHPRNNPCDGSSPRSGRSISSDKNPTTTRLEQQRDTPELLSAGFSHIIPRANNGIGRKVPIKLPAVLGASPRELDTAGPEFADELGNEGERASERSHLEQQVEHPPTRRVTGELLSPWQVRLRRKRLAEMAAAARADQGAASAAVVAAREAQRKWVPASTVDALPDPRLEARVSARDRLPKSTAVDTLVLQNGVVGAPSLNGESNAMRALKAGTLKHAKRLKARARCDERRDAQQQSQEAALSRLTSRAPY